MSKIIKLSDFRDKAAEVADDATYRAVLVELATSVENRARQGCLVSKLYRALVEYLDDEKNVAAFRGSMNFKELDVVDGGIYRFEISSTLSDYVGSFVAVERLTAPVRIKGARFNSNVPTLHFSHTVLQMVRSDVALAGPTAFITDPITRFILNDNRNLLNSNDAVGLEALLREDNYFDVKVTYGGWFETRNIGQ